MKHIFIKQGKRPRSKQYEIKNFQNTHNLSLLINSGEEKYLKLKYMSDNWLRLKIHKHLLKEEAEKEPVAPPSVGYNPDEITLSSALFRLPALNKLASFLLLFWMLVIPQTESKAAVGAKAGDDATVRVYPKDSQTGEVLSGVLVEVYDETGALIDSGVSDEDGVTFGLLTGVEDLQNAASVKFFGNTLQYALTRPSEVAVTLTDVLGRTYELYRANLSSGEHSFKINAASFANGFYVLQINTKDFTGAFPFIKVDNKLISGANYKVKYYNQKQRTATEAEGKITEGRWYKFIATASDHYKDSTEAVVSNDISLDILMDKTKSVHFMLYNNDTDSLDVGYVKVSGDSVYVDGEADLAVNYADTLKFIGGILTADSVYESTKRIMPDKLPDTVKLTAIDMYLRDLEGNVVGSLLDGRRVNPSIFKLFMNTSFFTSDYNGVGEPGNNYDDCINRWSKSNNNEMPDSIVVYKYAQWIDGSHHIMDQVTIDRLVKLYNTRLKPFLDEENLSIPFIIDTTVTYIAGPIDEDDIIDYMAIMPTGDLNVDGELMIAGEFPSVIRYNLIRLRSGPPYFDPGELPGRRAALQELTGLEATRSPPPDDHIMHRDETIIHNYTQLTDYSLYDIKAFRIWHEMDWPTGTKEEDIMHLVGN